MCQCAKVSMCQCAMAHLCVFANLLLASFSAAGHTCPGTNSWCYLPLEDSVLVLFLPFQAPYFIRQKDSDLAQNLCVEPKTPPRSKSKSWQMEKFWPKNFVKGRVVRHYYEYDEGSQKVQLQSQGHFHFQPNWIYKGRSSTLCNHINSSLCQNTGNESFQIKSEENSGSVTISLSVPFGCWWVECTFRITQNSPATKSMC